MKPKTPYFRPKLLEALRANMQMSPQTLAMINFYTNGWLKELAGE